jgi:hypothetical protein
MPQPTDTETGSAGDSLLVSARKAPRSPNGRERKQVNCPLNLTSAGGEAPWTVTAQPTDAALASAGTEHLANERQRRSLEKAAFDPIGPARFVCRRREGRLALWARLMSPFLLWHRFAVKHLHAASSAEPLRLFRPFPRLPPPPHSAESRHCAQRMPEKHNGAEDGWFHLWREVRAFGPNPPAPVNCWRSADR